MFEAVHQRSLRLHSAPAFTACPRRARAMAAWLRPLSPARLCRATPALSPHASAEASDRPRRRRHARALPTRFG